MAIELVPAIERHFKTYSTWIALVGGTFDILYLLNEAIKDQIDPHTFVIINATLIALIKFSTLLKQHIPVTPESKQELIKSAFDTPIKEKKDEVTV
jgi:hypothetical protein